jgi:hypothetical protein
VRAAVNDDSEADAVDFWSQKKSHRARFDAAFARARGNGHANDPARFARDFGARGARAATTRE